MTTLFGKLFRSKNKANKENVEPTELEHNMAYRRSFSRGGTNQSTKSRGKSTRFDCSEDGFLPATAPYHTVTAPKMHKGPQSCPGGYKKDDFGSSAMNLSFVSEFVSDRRDREQRNRRHRGHDYKHHGNRSSTGRETSEYGSGDPSPTAQFHRHSNYRQELDESENETYDYTHDQKTKQLEDACRHAWARWKRSEERHMYYKHELKKMQKAKDDSEKVYLVMIENMKKEHIRNLQKIKSLETQLAASQSYAFEYETSSTAGTSTIDSSSVSLEFRGRNPTQLSSFRGYCNLPGSGNAQFNFPLSSQNNRMTMMPSLSLPSNAPTPSTSALNSTGAGEALTERSDISILPHAPCFDASFGLLNSTGDLNFDVTRPISDDMDETKTFRANNDNSFVSMAMETPREANESGTSIGLERTSSVVLSHRDDGYSTCSTLTRTASSTSNLRRSSSDSKITSPMRRNL